MRGNHIKKLAKEVGVRVKDLLAMSRNRDPFYLDVPYKIEAAEWFKEVFDRFGSRGYHLRRLHYKIIGQVKKPKGGMYQNVKEDWKYLISASGYARDSGLVSYNALVDRRNPPPKVVVDHNPDPVSDFKVSYGSLSIEEIIPWVETNFNRNALYDYHIEVWAEKSTMDDILIPLCRRYGIYLISGAGFESKTHMNDLLERILSIDKPCRVFYISDFDRAGQSMPRQVARNLEYRIDQGNLQGQVDIRLKPIILLREHVERYDLPSAPGSKQTELDALEALYPGELERIVELYLKRYVDLDKIEKIKEKVESERSGVEQLIDERVKDEFGEKLENLENQISELRGEIHDFVGEMNLEEFSMPNSTFKIQEVDGWLYKSGLDYFDQLKRYKKFQEGQSF